MKNQCPYLNDLIAGFIFVLIVLLSQILNHGDSLPFKVIGLCLFTSALLFWLLPVISFHQYGELKQRIRYFETDILIDRGIYSLLRHPQYLAYIFLVFGFAFISQHWMIFILALSAVIFFILQTKEEDRQLLQKYGDRFQIYRQNTPGFNFLKGWILRRRRKKS